MFLTPVGQVEPVATGTARVAEIHEFPHFCTETKLTVFTAEKLPPDQQFQVLKETLRFRVPDVFGPAFGAIHMLHRSHDRQRRHQGPATGFFKFIARMLLF